jgi:hypothetical protein
MPGETDAQFWWNWWVSCATAVGTIGAVVAALFGDPIRRKFAPPRLQIRLSDNPAEGTKALTKLTVTVNGQPQERQTQSRWYHVRVENLRRHYTTATEVRLWLLELKIQDAGGSWRTEWIGELPMTWKDQIVKLPTLTMGQPDEADLCFVNKDDPVAGEGKHLLQLTTAIFKSPPPLQWTAACHIMVKLQARSIETASNIYAVEIHWDGQWDDDDTKMRNQHLAVHAAA